MFLRASLLTLTVIASASAAAATSVSNVSFINGITIAGNSLDLSSGSDFDH